MKSIYDLDLHEVIKVHNEEMYTSVMRVPGGWIYRTLNTRYSVMSNTFVPFTSQLTPSRNFYRPPEPTEEKEVNFPEAQQIEKRHPKLLSKFWEDDMGYPDFSDFVKAYKDKKINPWRK